MPVSQSVAQSVISLGILDYLATALQNWLEMGRLLHRRSQMGV